MISKTILQDLNLKIFADGADINQIRALNETTFIKGFTTNPTLMKKAGVGDYRSFAKDTLNIIGGKPISFEVFSDDIFEMRRQALEISSWGENVYVKIPVCNSKGELNLVVIKELTELGVKVNITAVMTMRQIESCMEALDPSIPSYISVFAGRIADTGRNPAVIIKEALQLLSSFSLCELIWASTRGSGTAVSHNHDYFGYCRKV
jgi:transaldolase